MAAPGCLRVVIADASLAELVADVCWALGATAVGEGDGRLDVGFVTTADAEAAAAGLTARWPELVVTVVDATADLQAAMEAWRPHARAVRVGPLHVRPAWLGADVDPPAAGERLVLIDPTLAFGYDHPSTVMCLKSVLAHMGPGTSVLDVGCGSGVLALAAAVLGAGRVVAVDTDPVAVAATAAAALAAGLSIDASDTPVESVDGTFDLVVANIGARALTAMAPALAARVAPGGRLTLAGLLVDQAPSLVAAYEAEGLELEGQRARSGWATPTFLGKSTFSGA